MPRPRKREQNPRICTVPGCLSVQNNNRKYYRFPKDPKIRKLWTDAIGCPKLKETPPERLIRCFVCDLHFDPYNADVMTKKKRRRPVTVVPTFNLMVSEIEYPSKVTQTFDEELQHALPDLPEPESKKLKLDKELIEKGSRDRGDSPELKVLVQLKRELKNKLKHVHVTKIQYCALHIFMGSPQYYRVFGQVLGLPSVKTLRKTFVGMNLSSDMLQCVQARINRFNEAEKYCVICADEIELKSSLYYQIDRDKIIGLHEIEGKQTTEPATHALVVMARGIFSDWHQPLGYCFLGQSKNYSELNTWIDGMISKVLCTGLEIAAFVAMPGRLFSYMAKDRLVPHLETQFTVDESVIRFMFDIPELMRSLIDILMWYDFEFHDVDETNLTATWSDIETLYKIDSERAHQLAPGLTKCHIDRFQARNMNIDVAKESFSKKVATAMNFYKDQGLIREECLGTIKLIELLNETFDVLNSSLPTYPTANKNQMEILNRFLDFLCDVTIRDKITGEDTTNAIQCLNGLKISLKSIIDLNQSLLWKGFRALPTRRLNQNVLQEFIDKLRQRNSKPMPLQLSRAFQKLFMTQLLSHSRHSDDLDQFVEGTEHIIASIEGGVDPTEAWPLNVQTVDYRFSLPKQHALWHLSVYLLNKCYEMHRCNQFDEYLRTAKRKDRGDGVQNPPDSFFESIKKLDDKFVYFIRNKTFVNIGNEVLAEMKAIKFCWPCACFPRLHLKCLFIRFRIFDTVRFNNKNLKADACNPKCIRVRTLDRTLPVPCGPVEMH